MRNVIDRLWLNTQFLVDDTIWGNLGGASLLEETPHWEQTLIYIDRPYFQTSLFFLWCDGISHLSASATMPGTCCHASSSWLNLMLLGLWVKISFPKSCGHSILSKQEKLANAATIEKHIFIILLCKYFNRFWNLYSAKCIAKYRPLVFSTTSPRSKLCFFGLLLLFSFKAAPFETGIIELIKLQIWR